MNDELEGSVGGWSVRGGEPGGFEALSPERYRIEGLLGQGGMGEVYLAWDRHLEREVALKRLRPGNPAASLLAEARVAARLDHAGIVPVLDYGTLSDGTHFYTMRRVEGRTLDAVTPDPPQQVLAPLRAAVHAIAFAHGQGIVHRDLKPSNLMVGPYGETQVVDWGLACRQDEARPGRFGTPRYLAEETRTGAPHGPADDVYALGATLVEVCTGRHADDPAGWRQLAETVRPAELAAIARRALAPLPRRYPDARALAADLDAWFERRLVEAHDYSPLELARWLVWRMRVPLALFGVAILAGGVALSATGRRILAERTRAQHAEVRASEARDAADALLADSLSRQALAALQRRAFPEALVLAERALERAGSPRARGVKRAIGPSGLPPVHTQATSCRGRLSGTPDRWLCVDGQGATDAHGAPIATEPVDAAVPTSSGGWIRTRRRDRHVGGVAVERAGLLAVRGDQAAQVMRDEVRFLSDAGVAAVVRPCERSRAARAFAWSDAGLWIPCEDGTVVRLAERRVAQVLTGMGDEAVTALAVADEVWLGHADGIVRHDLAGVRLGRVHSDVGVVRRLELEADWALVEGDRGGPVLVDRETGRTALALPRSWRGANLDGGRVVSAREGTWHTLRLADLPRPSPVLASGIAAVAVAPGASEVSVALGDGSVGRWRPETSDVQTRMLHRGYVTKDLTYTASGALFAANMQGEPYHLAAELQRQRTGGRPCRRLYSLGDTVWCLAYTLSGPIQVGPAEPLSPVETLFVDAGAASTRAALLDDTGQLWLHDADGLRPVARPLDGEGIRAAASEVGPVAFASDETLLWLSPTGEVRDRVATGGVLRSLAVAPGAGWVAAGMLDGRTALWRVEQGRLALHAWLEGVHDQRVASVWVDDAGQVVTAGWDGRVHRWQAAGSSDVGVETLEVQWAIPLEALLTE